MQCWVQLNDAEIENLELYQLIVNQVIDRHCPLAILILCFTPSNRIFQFNLFRKYSRPKGSASIIVMTFQFSI